jgi:hypothetical protein
LVLGDYVVVSESEYAILVDVIYIDGAHLVVDVSEIPCTLKVVVCMPPAYLTGVPCPFTFTYDVIEDILSLLFVFG